MLNSSRYWRVTGRESRVRVREMGREVKIANLNCGVIYIYQFSSVQSLSRLRLFATLWTAARQASGSITIPGFTQTHVNWVGNAIQPYLHIYIMLYYIYALYIQNNVFVSNDNGRVNSNLNNCDYEWKYVFIYTVMLLHITVIELFIFMYLSLCSRDWTSVFRNNCVPEP